MSTIPLVPGESDLVEDLLYEVEGMTPAQAYATQILIDNAANRARIEAIEECKALASATRNRYKMRDKKSLDVADSIIRQLNKVLTETRQKWHSKANTTRLD